MLWYKSLHIIFMATWFAGLFYLPRLFVYHAMSDDETSLKRFETMERKLFWGIMTPGGVLTIIFGILLIQFHGLPDWLKLKIFLVLLLVVYHLWCGSIMYSFKKRQNTHSHVWLRIFNEVPVLLLFLIIYLVVFKPF
mgnify:FL=1|jgi:putative membrane protein